MTTHQTPSLASAPPRIDVPALQAQLLGRWAEARTEARALLDDPRFVDARGATSEEHRRQVLQNVTLLAREGRVQRGFPREYGGQDDPGGSVAAFEELIAIDPSTAIKSGVQWGLFSSAILHLGTQSHHRRFLPSALSLEVPGCYAMTETGHGSDVAAIGTTATYDVATEEFVINTPTRSAWKDYLGNAALHGTAAIVFAQLITQGVEHGVHAFYVPIRDPETGEFLPGVGGEDDGLKGGLNGVDNGRLHFSEVRVPRVNLLNRYGDVAADGRYSSPIASPGRRFFTMLATLVQGRVSLDGAAGIAGKIGLTIAIRYGNERRQFSDGSGSETVLLDYGQHQHRLLPLLAESYAGHFAHEELLAQFDAVFSDPDPGTDARQELETMAAALKPLSSWHTLKVLQEAREACGGAGYLAENRLTGLRADLDIFATFEGDNTVLLQLVAKRLLADYSSEFTRVDATVAAKYFADRASDIALHRIPLRRFAQTLWDTGDPRRQAGHLREADTQRDLLSDRARTLVADVAAQLRGASRLRGAESARLFSRHQPELIEAARAYGEYVQWAAFTGALDTMEESESLTVLTWLRNLFGMTLLERNLAWYLISGRLAAGRARTVVSYRRRLEERLRPFAGDLVEAFGLPDSAIRAAIATGAEGERQREAAAYYRKLRASSSAPMPEPRAG